MLTKFALRKIKLDDCKIFWKNVVVLHVTTIYCRKMTLIYLIVYFYFTVLFKMIIIVEFSINNFVVYLDSGICYGIVFAEWLEFVKWK